MGQDQRGVTVRATGSRLWLDREGGLGEDSGFEGSVVGGDELDLDHVLAWGEVREAGGAGLKHPWGESPVEGRPASG